MKNIIIILGLLCFINLPLFAAIPTEEGLLRNLSNPNPAGKMVSIQMAINNEFMKVIFLLDRPNTVDMVQVIYGDSQMQASQIKDIKFIHDLPLVLAKEPVPQKNLFYGVLLMLATNRSIGMETFLEKNGVTIAKNKNLINEEKMNLLKSYHSYLLNNKGKGEVDSPLNPANPEEKAKVVSLFKSNTYMPSKNIELVKIGDKFLWKADWKSVQGYFTNEERRLKKIEYKTHDSECSIEASEYSSFNGNNDLPKFIEIKNEKGSIAKIQIIGEEVSSKRNIDEFKKKILAKKEPQEILSFLY